MSDERLTFLARLHPYDQMPDPVRADIARHAEWVDAAAGDDIYLFGEELRGLYIVAAGMVEVRDRNDAPVSVLGPGNSLGERGLMQDGTAATSARAVEDARLIRLPAGLFHRLWAEQDVFRRFFDRRRAGAAAGTHALPDLASVRVETLMIADPVTCAPGMTVREAARAMRDRRISCLCVTRDGALAGIVTLRDLAGKALAEGMAHDTPVETVMTPDPRTLPPSAIGSDVLHMMMEHKLGHLPIVAAGRLVGIVTQTDLTRYQAASAAGLVGDAAQAGDVAALAAVTARIPGLLVQLVAAGNRHDVTTRLITDVADVVTRRLLRLAEEEFGPPPARYLWLACGSQGRQEQTGVSDQDNCLILEDGIGPEAGAYFERLARFVSDGLDACGYVYCPGGMMATNPRWRQPLSAWRDYFHGWIAQPGKEAQMLASVMFDLRPVGGDASLFEGLQADTLRAAAANSIFAAHMATNALSHATPLGMLRGFATIRSGEHRNTIDTKLNGVVPVVDLGRMYALQGQIRAVNTRARLEQALAAGIISGSGGRDLIDAYDLVAQTRLQHQAGQIKQGRAPDNFLAPSSLSDFERSHLRNAFVVIKTMQSALMQGRGILG